QPLLQVERLSKRYGAAGGLFGGSRETIAVKEASFCIAQDEFVALVGESGSGKSTIAKLLAGIEQPANGRILLDGVDLTANSWKTRERRINSVQMVLQDPQSALNPRRKVASLVTQVLEADHRRAPLPERVARAKVLLSEVGLAADLAGRFPAQLSGGQRQR